MNPTTRAIDVGFGLTKYITASDGAKIDCAHFPSLSFYSPTESPVDGLGGRRKTVCVPVGDLFFEVGPEVELAADRFRARQLHDGYTETPEYRAFMAGALHYMREDVIDHVFHYGRPGDYPIAGNWNGSGIDTSCIGTP